jgi:hypothetical protein
LDILAILKDDLVAETKLNYKRFWKIMRIGAVFYTVYMLLDPVQRWLRQKIALVGHLFCAHRPDLALQLGGCYDWSSHAMSASYIGEGVDFPGRTYKHVHAVRSSNSKKYPFHDYLKKVGIGKFWVLALVADKTLSGENRKLLETGFQQWLQPTLNVSISSRPVKLSKVMVNKPIMKIQGKSKQMVFPAQSLMRFDCGDYGKNVFQLQQIFYSMLKDKKMSALIDIIPGSCSLQTSFAVLGPFKHTVVAGCESGTWTQPMPLFILLKRYGLKSFSSLGIHSIVWVDEDLYLKGHLRACLRKPFLFFNMKHIPPHAFLQLYRAAELFQKNGTRHVLKSRIANSFKVRFGFSLTKKPTLSLPFCQEVELESCKTIPGMDTSAAALAYRLN